MSRGTPSVLSLGRLCKDEGFDLCWPRYSDDPYMVGKDRLILRFKEKNYVPVLNSKVEPEYADKITALLRVPPYPARAAISALGSDE